MKRRIWGACLAAGLGLGAGLWSEQPLQARVIGRSAEISLGRETASLVEEFYAVDRDPAAAERVRRIGRRLAAASSERRFPYEFHVVESPEVNAFALPGGFIYIFRGLLQLLPDDDALAFVLAHELTHVDRRHAVKQFEKNVLLSLGLNAVLGGSGRGWARAGDAVGALASLSFTRGDETDADEEGVKLMAAAGYDARAAERAMAVILRTEPPGGETVALLRSHPVTAVRVRRLREAGASLAAAHVPRPAGGAAPAAAPLSIELPEGLTPAPSEWIPLEPGTRWTYRIAGAGVETGLQVRVVEHAFTDPAGPVWMEFDYLNGVSIRRLALSARDALHLRAGAGETSWVELFRLPERVETEKVSTPAGEFEAVRVTESEGESRATAWYARGIGLVRRQRADSVQELLSVELPPVKPQPAASTR